jgi:hypothetical protein
VTNRHDFASDRFSEQGCNWRIHGEFSGENSISEWLVLSFRRLSFSDLTGSGAYYLPFQCLESAQHRWILPQKVETVSQFRSSDIPCLTSLENAGKDVINRRNPIHRFHHSLFTVYVSYSVVLFALKNQSQTATASSLYEIQFLNVSLINSILINGSPDDLA